MYEIIDLLNKCRVVRDFEILEWVDEDELQLIRVKAKLTDRSILFINEANLKSGNKYSYHWQDERGRLRIRWDNAPHWKGLKTYPFHQHVGKQKPPLPSYEITLKDVLKVIEEKIE